MISRCNLLKCLLRFSNCTVPKILPFFLINKKLRRIEYASILSSEAQDFSSGISCKIEVYEEHEYRFFKVYFVHLGDKELGSTFVFLFKYITFTIINTMNDFSDRVFSTIFILWILL